MIVMAVDPGLDHAGVALFDGWAYLRAARPGPSAALACWSGSFHIATDPTRPLAARLRTLALDAEASARGHGDGRTIVYVEEPERSGQYSRTGRKNAAAVAQLHMAMGAILAGLEAALPGNIELVRAGTDPKKKRQGTLEYFAQLAQIRLPTGKRGGTSGAVADERDALYLGWWALQHRLATDTKARGW